MSSQTDDRDPIEVLYSIEEKVEEATNTDPIEKLSPRINPDKGTNRYKLLEYIRDNGWVEVSECKDLVGESTTRALTTLYYTYAVERRKNSDNKFEYNITPVGEKILSKSQQTLSDVDEKGEKENEKRPWEAIGFPRLNYYALKCIYEANDAPRTSDINEEFLERSGATRSKPSGPTVSSYVSKLYNDGYVDRTPSQPYRYWLTDDGKEVLND
jgi:predicted transcriptional regulator